MTDNLETPKDPKLYRIWFRARTKSFAHDFSSIRLKKEIRREYRREILWSVLAILLLVLGLSLSDEFIKKDAASIFVELNVDGNNVTDKYFSFYTKLLIVASSVVSIISLFLAIISERMNKILLQGQHEFISNLYLSISQKVRQMEAGLFDPAYKQYLILYLNDQIRDMLSNAEAPSDIDYRDAHDLMRKIVLETYPAVVSTFKPDIEDEEFNIEEEFRKISDENSHKRETRSTLRTWNAFLSLVRKVFMRRNF